MSPREEEGRGGFGGTSSDILRAIMTLALPRPDVLFSLGDLKGQDRPRPFLAKLASSFSLRDSGQGRVSRQVMGQPSVLGDSLGCTWGALVAASESPYD